MSFRRNKDDARERKRWRAFCAEHRCLLEAIGLPATASETSAGFADLLMHGHLDHHVDPTSFRVDNLDAAELELFKELVWGYFAAGYADPGLMAVGAEERRKLAQVYPVQFDGTLNTDAGGRDGRT